ncbi:MAG: hypothetical protein PHG83_00490 [Patescibacteria group bacterium]|nr:hypothetical protein [Patescibacteria group bacterium]
MSGFERFGEGIPGQEEIKKIDKQEIPTNQSPEGQIFNSLRVEEQKNEQQELMDNFDEILKEPREVLGKLEELGKKYKQKPVSALLWNICDALNKDIESKQLNQAKNLIEQLEESNSHILNKENFKNVILSKAEENHLIHLVSSKAFDRQARERAQQEGRLLVQPAQPFEFYYRRWETDPETHKPILQIDQYQFSGDPSLGAAKLIFYELSEYASLIEPLEKISYLTKQYQQGIQEKSSNKNSV